MPDLPRLAVPAPPTGRGAPSRRALLRGAAGLAAAGLLTGCGRIELGGPARYTPPPPGIDDLYRTDLLAVLDRALAGVEQLTSAAAAVPAVAAALAGLAEDLPVQRRALLTGAQVEDELEAREHGPAATSSPPAATDAPGDAASLVAVLVELRDLAAAAARQVSGSLARPTVAIAAHTAWAARRLRAAAGAGEVPAAPAAEELVPRREVPATDPPSIGAESDYHSTLERAQQEEWYTGYLHEVLAARSEDEARAAHLERSALHRGRAEQLGLVAEEDGAPVVPRQAVYAIPGGTLDDELAGQLPTLMAQTLLGVHIALVGAAPFERRPLPIEAALAAAERLSSLVDELAPVPSLEVEEPPPAEG